MRFQNVGLIRCTRTISVTVQTVAERRKDQDEESVIIYNSYARIMQREQRESEAAACVFIAREKNFCT